MKRTPNLVLIFAIFVNTLPFRISPISSSKQSEKRGSSESNLYIPPLFEHPEPRTIDRSSEFAPPYATQPTVVYFDTSGMGYTETWTKAGGNFWSEKHIYVANPLNARIIGSVFSVEGNAGNCQFKRMDSDISTNTSDSLQGGNTYASIGNGSNTVWGLSGVPYPWANDNERNQWIATQLGTPSFTVLGVGNKISQVGDQNINHFWHLGWNCTGGVTVTVIGLIGLITTSSQALPAEGLSSGQCYEQDCSINTYRDSQSFEGDPINVRTGTFDIAGPKWANSRQDMGCCFY